MDVISGEKIQSWADIVICTPAIYKFHKNITKYSNNIIVLNGNLNTINSLTDEQSKEIDKCKILFIYTHITKSFLDLYLEKTNNNFTIITHNSDIGIDVKFLKYLNNNHILKWYAQNVCIKHPKLNPLPIGIANSQWRHGNLSILNQIISESKMNKEKLVYLNYKINTNKSVRKPIFKLLSSKKFVTCNSNLSYQDYLKELSQHKFCIVPPGNGIDCHRTWECLYLGVIPILQNCICNEIFQNLNLPVLLVDQWNFEKEFLENKYKLLILKEYDRSILELNFWKSRII